jgi:sterol desaturase/sphingolipid hydroxylase (fatty acid hydroxylase superfamily)
VDLPTKQNDIKILINERMNELIHYFQHIPSAHRSLILVGGLTLFSLLESGIPMFSRSYRKMHHAGINILFTLTTIVVNFVLAFLLLEGSRWAVANNFGILQWLPAMPLWLYMVVGLLLLDLIGAYFVHWTEHKVKWMWRFHLIHHTDPNVDTTSANRHHPGESVFRFVFTAAGAVLVGADWWIVMMYQSMSAALSQFNHANIKFPAALDRALSWAIVTPGMHRVHHHYVLPYTDSNFGNIFSIWDRLFGTYMWLPQEQIKFGIDTHMLEEEHSNMKRLMTIPFEEYRSPIGAKFD